MIYIVNGFPNSGKTTFEDMVCKMMGGINAFGFKISTIDFVKEIARYCGWDGSKDLHNRKFLADLKTLLTQWNDVPYKKIAAYIYDIQNMYGDYELDFDKCAIFIDCREPDEIRRLCQDFHAKSLLIRRPDDESIETSNGSDSQVLNYNYDITIYNDGDLSALLDKASKFIDAEHLYKFGK